MTTLAEQVAAQRLDLAQQRHSPTRSMQVVAKRGVRMSAGRDKLDPIAITVGRKVASGQKLSGDHVEAMAFYHASHDGACPTGMDDTSVEDMLWGGAPGAHWSGARVAAMDASELAQSDAPTILALDQEGKGVSLEVFVRDGLGEPSQVDEEKSLIWAPILRSGMIATRPGPNGEKLDQPLVFVPGTASDPRKEIGLENLLASFQKKAIQHVTIPTRHDNDVLDNTGFIVDMKIVDSKKRAGEKVLVAAHDFRDPEVRRKVRLGTIANRSCGIVYDHKNTETGEVFEQAVDHVALTNRPWVTGMTAYGDINGEDDFGDREVVPMMLSEAPRSSKDEPSDADWDASPDRFSDEQWASSCVLDLGEGDAKDRYSLPIRDPDGALNADGVHLASERLARVPGANLAQKRAAARSLIAAHRKLGESTPQTVLGLVSVTTNMSDAERKSLLLADVQWGEEVSLNDITSQVVSQLQDFRSPEEYYPSFSVMDVTPSKALVRCHYGDYDDADDAWVIPLNVDGDQVQLADFSQWTPVEQQWVTDEDADQDKSELGAILGDKTSLSDELELDDLAGALIALSVSQADRDRAKASNNSLSDGSYPINNTKQLRAAAILAASKHGNWKAALRLVRRRAKELGVDVETLPGFKSDSKTNMSLPSGDPLKGGAMPPTVQQTLERLGLSDEQRAALAPLLTENQTLKTQLGEITKKSREETVKARVQELQGKKFPPGFCRRYEEIALGDDGEPAAVLNLSENGTQTGEKEYTATQIAESLIACLPVDESGALALAERGNLLTSPVGERPPLTAADQAEQEEKDGKKRPQTADEWLAEAEKVAPGVGASLQFSTDKKEG